MTLGWCQAVEGASEPGMKTGGGSAGRWRRLFPDDIVMKIVAALEGNTCNSLLLSANRRRIGEIGDLCDSPLE